MRRLAAIGATAALLIAPAIARADLNVGSDNHVKEVKTIGEDVRIDGTTSGPVVVIDGDLVIGPSGHVNGATVIGGRIQTQPGGELSGEVFHIAGQWPAIATWQILTAILVLFALRIVLSWTIVAFATQVTDTATVKTLTDLVRTRPIKAFAVGALAAFGIGAGAIVAALTVVGLAVAAALLGLLLVATVLGIAVGFTAAGTTATTRRLTVATLAVPIAGDALAALAAIVGMGAVLRQWADRPSQAPAAPEPVPLN